MTKETTPTKALTIAQIIEAQDCPSIQVDVPEWGGVVFIKTMTGPERADYDALHLEAAKLNAKGEVASIDYGRLREFLVSTTVTDENGNRIFKDEVSMNVLKNKSGAVLDRLSGIAQRHNKLSKEDIEEAKKP